MTQRSVQRRAGIAMVLLFFGCGQQPEEGGKDNLPLVQVGDYTVTVEELLTYEQNLPKPYRPSASGIDVRRDRLQGLVDRHLMLLEAESRGYREMPELLTRLEAMAEKKLMERITEEEIAQKVLPATEEELREVYEKYDLGWIYWPAHILSATEEDAWEIIRELENGADFAILARERSLADDADRGGDLRGFFQEKDVVPELWEATYHLSIGEFTRPVRTRDGWEVGKVLDKRRMSLGEVRGSIDAETRRRRWVVRRLEFLDELKAHFGVVYHGEYAGTVLAGIQEEKSPEKQMDAVLVSYQGEQLRVGSVIEIVKNLKKGPLPADSLALFEKIDRWVLLDTLMVRLARQRGYDEEPELLAWQEDKCEELMIKELYKQEVEEAVSVSPEEARRFYEERTELFNLPGEIHLTEVQVDTREEALEVLQAVQEGQAFTELARDYAKRQDEEIADFLRLDEKGQRVVNPMRSSPYHGLLADKRNQKIGKVQGPIEIGERFGVFRLDEPIGLFRIPYSRVRMRSSALLKKERRGQVFERFIISLREKHSGKIIWFDENLASLK